MSTPAGIDIVSKLVAGTGSSEATMRHWHSSVRWHVCESMSAAPPFVFGHEDNISTTLCKHIIDRCRQSLPPRSTQNSVMWNLRLGELWTNGFRIDSDGRSAIYSFSHFTSATPHLSIN